MGKICFPPGGVGHHPKKPRNCVAINEDVCFQFGTAGTLTSDNGQLFEPAIVNPMTILQCGCFHGIALTAGAIKLTFTTTTGQKLKRTITIKNPDDDEFGSDNPPDGCADCCQ